MNFRLKIYLAIFTLLLSAGIMGFMSFENMSLTNAIYFSIVTMATVGYGDICPQTEIGKILALIMIIGGVGTFLGIVAGITDLFVNRREEAIRQEKIDMMSGLFFSEMGNKLLNFFSRFDSEIGKLHKELKISTEWEDKDFSRIDKILGTRRISLRSRQDDIPVLLTYLQDNANLLLRLIENPIIHEHESFTELLRALFHLRDELLSREDLLDLLDSDRKHLEGDVARVYNLLLLEWLRYIRYLKKNYGYLFSLAIRTNPFNPDASAVVKEK
jgi:voltage-gated potassium channel